MASSAPPPAFGGPFRNYLRDQRRTLAALVLVVALLSLLYAPVFHEFVASWLQYAEYNYALLVPFISLFLVARRWKQLRAQPLAPSGRGVLLLGMGLALLVFGVATGVHVVQGLSFIPVALGLVWFLWSPGAARVLLFPIAYLACGLGLYRGLISSLGFAMQGITARYANVLANVLGVHSHRDGLLLNVGHTTYVVAEHCSGLSSLLALLALGWLVIGEGPGSPPYKVLLFLAITPLALIANIMRVALVLVIAQDISEAIAEGFVHGLFSATIFFITVILLMIVRKVLLWLDNSAMLSPRRAFSR